MPHPTPVAELRTKVVGDDTEGGPLQSIGTGICSGGNFPYPPGNFSTAPHRTCPSAEGSAQSIPGSGSIGTDMEDVSMIVTTVVNKNLFTEQF